MKSNMDSDNQEQGQNNNAAVVLNGGDPAENDQIGIILTMLCRKSLQYALMAFCQQHHIAISDGGKRLWTGFMQLQHPDFIQPSRTVMGVYHAYIATMADHATEAIDGSPVVHLDEQTGMGIGVSAWLEELEDMKDFLLGWADGSIISPEGWSFPEYFRKECEAAGTTPEKHAEAVKLAAEPLKHKIKDI